MRFGTCQQLIDSYAAQTLGTTFRRSMSDIYSQQSGFYTYYTATELGVLLFLPQHMIQSTCKWDLSEGFWSDLGYYQAIGFNRCHDQPNRLIS